MRYTVMIDHSVGRIRDQLTGHVDTQAYRDWDEAYRVEADLNARHDDTGGARDPATVRRVNPPKTVEIRSQSGWWNTGILDLWIRQTDGWYNRRELHLAGELAGLGEPGLRFGLIGLRCRAPDLRLWAGVCVRLALSSLRGGDRQRPGRAVDVGFGGCCVARLSPGVQLSPNR